MIVQSVVLVTLFTLLALAANAYTQLVFSILERVPQ